MATRFARRNLRTNAVGANLNRCWGRLHGIDECPGQTDPPAPEVEAMIKGMREVGGPDVMLGKTVRVAKDELRRHKHSTLFLTLSSNQPPSRLAALVAQTSTRTKRSPTCS